MLALLPLAMEILEYAPQAIALTGKMSAAGIRAVELWKAGPATTQDELAALKTDIDAEKAKLAEMTAELDRDPPAG